MNKAPNLWTLKSLLEYIPTVSAEIGGRWVPARPLGVYSIRHRLNIAWKVFTGKADAFTWPEEQ